MADFFDDINKILKKDLIPLLVKYFQDPNNKISDNLNNFMNNPQTFLTDIFDKLSMNKDIHNNQANYSDIEDVTDIDLTVEDEYDQLYEKLIVIEENMIQIENILKDKN